MKTDKVKLKELRVKHNRLVKTLERIRDDSGQWINDLAGDRTSRALYYTLKSVLDDI